MHHNLKVCDKTLPENLGKNQEYFEGILKTLNERRNKMANEEKMKTEAETQAILSKSKSSVCPSKMDNTDDDILSSSFHTKSKPKENRINQIAKHASSEEKSPRSAVDHCSTALPHNSCGIPSQTKITLDITRPPLIIPEASSIISTAFSLTNSSKLLSCSESGATSSNTMISAKTISILKASDAKSIISHNVLNIAQSHIEDKIDVFSRTFSNGQPCRSVSSSFESSRKESSKSKNSFSHSAELIKTENDILTYRIEFLKEQLNFLL